MNNQSIENLPEVLREIKTRPLMVLRLTVGAKPQIIGHTPTVNRLIGVLENGTFEGERLSGEVLPGGSDWQTSSDTGLTLLDCRFVLKTTDGELISIKYKGIRSNSPDVIARLAKGEAVKPEDYYLRISPQFETASEKYAWINHIVAVGVGDRQPGGPVYSVFEVL